MPESGSSAWTRGWNVFCSWFIYRFAQEVVLCRAADAPRTEAVTVTGHINEAGDVFVEDYLLPPIREGRHRGTAQRRRLRAGHVDDPLPAAAGGGRLPRARLMDVHALADFEPLAQAALSPEAFAYYAGGSWDERTLRENEAAFARRDAATARARRRLQRRSDDHDAGHPVSLPVGFAPAALRGLAHREGEVVPARVAGREGLIYGLSTFSNRSLETVASVGRGARWFQLYVQRDRGRSAGLVARAAEAGYAAIVLTVDLPLPGYRVRELRSPVRDAGPLGNVARRDRAAPPGCRLCSTTMPR